MVAVNSDGTGDGVLKSNAMWADLAITLAPLVHLRARFKLTLQNLNTNNDKKLEPALRKSVL